MFLNSVNCELHIQIEVQKGPEKTNVFENRNFVAVRNFFHNISRIWLFFGHFRQFSLTFVQKFLMATKTLFSESVGSKELFCTSDGLPNLKTQFSQKHGASKLKIGNIGNGKNVLAL